MDASDRRRDPGSLRYYLEPMSTEQLRTVMEPAIILWNAKVGHPEALPVAEYQFALANTGIEILVERGVATRDEILEDLFIGVLKWVRFEEELLGRDR